MSERAVQDERRRNQRAPLTLKIRIDGPGGRQTLSVRDVSYEGVFIECTRPMANGARIECRLDLPGKTSGSAERIEFTAEVRHQASKYTTSDGGGPYRGFGVRITRIGTDDQAALRRFLDAHLAVG